MQFRLINLSSFIRQLTHKREYQEHNRLPVGRKCRQLKFRREVKQFSCFDFANYLMILAAIQLNYCFPFINEDVAIVRLVLFWRTMCAVKTNGCVKVFIYFSICYMYCPVFKTLILN